LSDDTQVAKDDIVNQLILDIKAVALLSDNEETLQKIVNERIAGSQDDQVKKFIGLLTPKRRSSTGGSFLTALGELVLASFLFLAGLSLLAPSLLGLESPIQVLTYFQQLTSELSTSAFSNPVLPILDFIISLVLLLGAFQLLRSSSTKIRNA
jgi:hypothetical protein